MGKDVPFNENRGYVKNLGSDLSGGFGRTNTLAMDVDSSKLDFIKTNALTITGPVQEFEALEV
jgi:hypothetical protein